MKKKSKEFRKLNIKNRSVLINKVIVTQDFALIGSGYLITKLSDGTQRLDVADLNGKHLEPQVYQIQQNGPVMLGVTTFRTDN